MPNKLLINVPGWTGSVLYRIAYALVSLKKAEGDSVLYQVMNVIAGLLLIIYTYSLGAYATKGSMPSGLLLAYLRLEGDGLYAVAALLICVSIFEMVCKKGFILKSGYLCGPL